MSRRILLISTNRCTSPDPVFPLGLAYVNGALRQAGHETRMLDLQIDSERLEAVLAEFRPDAVGISLRNIDDVIIRKRETFFEDLIATCQRIRQQMACPIVLGGCGFSLFPRKLLELSGADFGVVGEGEKSVVELMKALEEAKDYSSIPGLVFRCGQKVIVNAPQPATTPLELDFADRPDALVTHYLATSGVLNIQTQRGCSFHCGYCTYPVIEGRRHRRRAPEAIAREMEQIQELGGKSAFIVDSVFNSSPTHVRETCEAILRRNLKIRWGCFLRPQGLTPELMHLMAQAGLSHIEFGSDSFCDPVLKAYGKNFTFEEIRHSTELAVREQIDCCHFLICGGPGETEQTLETSFENSRRLEGAVIMAVVGMRIYPGTPLFTRAQLEGVIGPETDLLHPAYYVSREVDVDRVFDNLKEFSRKLPSWIVGDHSPEYAKLVERLRKKGVNGPLWSYFSMIQRLWPQPPAPSHT